MQFKRGIKNKRDDEDSHNYVDDESEALTIEEETEVYVYSYKDALMDFLYSKRVVFSILGFCLFLASFGFRNTKFITVTNEGFESILYASSVLLLTSISIFVVMGLDYLLEFFSHAQLKRSRGSGAFWFYTNELSFHISMITVITFTHVYLLINFQNFYIKNLFSLKVYIHDAYRIVIVTLLLIAAENALAKYVSMGFNYNHYVIRIRKCLLFDLFISLLDNLGESDVLTEPAGSEDPVVLADDRGITFPNLFVLQKKYRHKTLQNLDFSSKRILIKEFQRRAKDVVSYSGSLPLILGKIRLLASREANKLVRKLIRKKKISQMGEFSRHFANPETFEYIMKQLELNKEERIERSNITRIIERAYREQYMIYKSIYQINSAINKVTLFMQVVTFSISLLILYISGIEQLGTVFGTLSAFFGTQFISRIIPDSMIKSIIFLFAIHPFDIGDRILVKLKGEEENLVAAELNVFSTLFYRWDGTSVFVPNHLLADTPITNLRRSGATMESHSIQINARTEPAKLESLKQQLEDFCRAHSDVYTDYILINYEKIEDSHKLYIKVLMQYQTNRQNYESYLKKKTMFLLELNRLIEALDIKYNLPIQKISLSGSNGSVADHLGLS